MNRKRRISTPILEMHGKIGPFFFKEVLLLFVLSSSLFFILLILGTLFYIPFLVHIGIPISILIIFGMIRFVFVRRIDTPWYIHKWIANTFIISKRLKGGIFTPKEQGFIFVKQKKSSRTKVISRFLK